MSFINKLIVEGHIGNGDHEIKTSKRGDKKYASFNLCHNYGIGRGKVSIIPIQAWGPWVDYVKRQRFATGDRVRVEGVLRTSLYTDPKTGIKKFATKCDVSENGFLRKFDSLQNKSMDQVEILYNAINKAVYRLRNEDANGALEILEYGISDFRDIAGDKK